MATKETRLRGMAKIKQYTCCMRRNHVQTYSKNRIATDNFSGPATTTAAHC